jgi:hypothetical protein
MSMGTRRSSAVVLALAAAGALAVAGVWLGAGSSTTTTFSASPAKVPKRAHPKVVMAAGDFNGSSQAGATARVMAAQHPVVILGLGDFQYEYGSHSAFVSGFRRQMTAHHVFSLFRPVAGPSHDVDSAGDAANYKANWHRNPFKAYSFNVGKRWHVVALPSPIYRYGMTRNQRTTLSWLRKDLTRSRARCTIAYWHEPFFTNSSSGHSASEGDYTRPWVKVLYAHHAEILLAGHQHGYARFRPQSPTKAAKRRGLTQYIVGTGGVGFYSWSRGEPNLVTQQSNTYGALRLTLRRSGWGARFLRSGGGHYTDKSSGKCH